MRIMLDSNILVSAGAFGGRVAEALGKIANKHKIFVSNFANGELHDVIDRKYPERKERVALFMLDLPHTISPTPKNINPADYPHIRDPDDLPILVSAILANVDVLITGDTDFAPVNIKHPEILTISDFIEKYD